MTGPQRITLMADWWPKACRAQGWKSSDRALRLRVLSEAVKRPLASAGELNTREDIDAVKAHLGMLANNVDATIETDNPDIGRARRLRVKVKELGRCLAVYHPNAPGYLAEIIKDKFNHGSRVEPLHLDDLSAEPKRFTDRKTGKLREIPSQLDQVVMKMSGAVQKYRSESGDSLHEMKIKAGVHCSCSICEPRRPMLSEIPAMPQEEKKAECPF